MKKRQRYNVIVSARVANMLLASLSISSQPDEDARLQLANALFLVGEAIRGHEQDVLALAASSRIMIDVEVIPYRVS